MKSRREAMARAARARALGQSAPAQALKAPPWRAALARQRATRPSEPLPASTLGSLPLISCGALCAFTCAPFALAWGASLASCLLSWSAMFTLCIGACSWWTWSRASKQSGKAGAFHRACLPALEALAPSERARAFKELSALGSFWKRRHAREEHFLRQADALAGEALRNLGPAPSPRQAIDQIKKLRSEIQALQ